MDAQDRSRSPSRKTSRVEQVVVRWLRRSRDLSSRSHSLSRDRVEEDGKTAESSSDERNHHFRFNVQIQRDPSLNSHGLTLTSQSPILVQDVTPGGPADGRLVPGDQLVKINNVAADDLTPEQAAEIIRECQDTLTMTVLRTMLGPKSSFITPEKRAKLKSNPVKVHFAEEVEVNGHSQGNSLLFLPNVLKVYLENGQTKAFKFEPCTTVKDIVMTLKDKLSLSRIEHFSLVLEQKHSITKLLLLHDEERIQEVVQKKEVHDYRCLFRVYFMPKEPKDLLVEDPTAFEYLYLQGVNDVLQERFAVEMRCNTALRLAALHIQERLACCGQSPKTNLKTITRTWGIENFVSSTLLRNMREKDLRKAIGYHMKKQAQHEPKQKSLSVNQARINYLEELCDLKSFGGKSFSATMMLQDRESMVTLLVGARYGVSQVINHKLSILTTLTEFTSITRIELLPESEKVSLVKIYLQDIKPITLLLESVAAKDMSCLIAGYCRAFVDPNLDIFPWIDDSKKHRVSAEEGYVSRCGSDSDDSDMDMEEVATVLPHDDKPCSLDPEGRQKKDRERRRTKDGGENADKLPGEKREKDEKDADTEKNQSLAHNDREDKDKNTELKPEMETVTEIHTEITDDDSGEQQKRTEMQKEAQESVTGGEEEVQIAEEQRSVSEASDSCQSDSRVVTSPSSDSLDALEEDDLISCSSSSIHPFPGTPLQTRAHFDSALQLHPYCDRHAQPHLLAPPPAHSHPLIQITTPEKRVDRRGRAEGGEGCRRSGDGADPQLLSLVYASSSIDHMQKCPADPCSDDSPLSFTELTRLVDSLPSPPEASDDECEEEELTRRRMKLLKGMEEFIRRAGEGGGSLRERSQSPSPSSPSSHMDFVFNFNENDAQCYYKLCSNITPDSARSLPQPQLSKRGEEEQEVEVEQDQDQAKAADLEGIPILQPPPGFGDSSSDEEFYDASDRFTLPEDLTSGTVPRDFCRKMKLDLRSTLSLGDVRVSVADSEGKAEADRERGEEAGGGRETLFQLRKRSRKRRSYMETDYTSTVSYPEPNPKSKQDQISSRHQRKLLSQTTDDHSLSSDPEPSEQTQIPCPTVSSLTHCEGEPTQLVSKPILSKSRSHSLSTFGPQGQARDPPVPSRGKKQEMEMEPDSMESKSVTDLVKVISPTITVVRCRVDPDGKESTDRRADGKEEGLGEDEKEKAEIVKGRSEGEQQESSDVSRNGPFTSHMFLPVNIEEGVKREETGEDQDKEEKGFCSSSEIPLITSEKQTESNMTPVCVIDRSKNDDNGPLSTPEQNLYKVVHMLESASADLKPLSYSPPPPPPSSPLPPLPILQKSPSDHGVREDSKTMGGSSRMFSSDPEDRGGEPQSPEILMSKHNNGAQPHLEVTSIVMEDEAMAAVSSALTASDEVTDSTNSDNVFDDDEVNNSLNSNSSDKKPVDRTLQTVARNHTVSDDSVKSQMRISTNTEAHVRSHSDTETPSVQFDYTADRSSIAANIETASFTSPTNISGVGPHTEQTRENALCSQDSTVPSVKVEDSFATVILAKTHLSPINDPSKQPPSRNPFLFPTCSPNIMGRLSASTLRGKIQSLPLYLSRSQESLNQSVVGNLVQSPFNRNDTCDVSETADLETSATVESAESDDSDTTITGSEVDGEIVLETVSGEMSHSIVSEVNVRERVLMFESLPVQTEPKPEYKHHPRNTGPNNNTPGPITEPPCPTVGNPGIQRDIRGRVIDVPGPIKDAPESKPKVSSTYVNIPGNEISHQSPFSSPPIVVTTQNLNGPGFPFHSQSHKVTQKSSDRPLIGLCSNTAQNSDSEKTHSSGCTVFTICENRSQTTTPALLGSTTPLKPDFGCSSLLASACESVVEGVQIPLDACGCPMVYTNCFSRGDSFDDELTVYEFSCRSQSSSMTQTSGSGPLMTATPVPTYLSTQTPPFPSSSLSPSFPRSILFSSSTSELSPLLSPLLESSDGFLTQTYKDTLSRLGQQQYPEPPAGFQELRVDVDQLLSIIESGAPDHSVIVHGGRHPRDACPAHFTENNQALHIKARRLMAGCQKVVVIGQSPEEMFHSLADCFQTLVNLASICLWFSGCDRCDRRNTEAVAGLADVARSFRDFCLAAERASSKRSCQDLSTKLLAKQCTALTASVFCLTQLFRTLTAL
ncbi:uncharacterized protein frmpd1a [Genypterus blacodes]|uniref:uncharacterized protein frmpd1a n=1 Tax=Genypterus blacodes TaxID=154954 RepID=UPI003F75F36C